MTLVLVGQAPGKHPRYEPKYALYPFPPRCTGARLQQKMGLSRRDYIALPRYNTLDFYPGARPEGGDVFPLRMAREAANRLAREKLIGTTVLFVGQKTADAFRRGSAETFVWYPEKAFAWCVIPHLSGLCRWWSDPVNDQVGSQFLYEIGQSWLRERPSFRIPADHRIEEYGEWLSTE